ncbi:MAG: inositol monophosphatase [Bacteroidales bacterium]|nr:inositol monophosphatase [Bacteroidales bacterium]
MLGEVVKIVREASLIMYKRDFTVRSKGGYENLVTSSDEAVQALLRERLADLLPGSGFICEEDDIKDTAHEYVWIIDPIDGTCNFSRGISECCISVALRKGTEIVLAVVYNPYRKALYTALKGRGARLNGRLIHVSDRPFSDGLLCTALCVYSKQYSGICSDIIREVFPKCNDVRRFGSAALELCYLAQGLCDLYFEYRVNAWDYSAAYLVLKEAGGVLTGRDGEKLGFDRPTILVGANNEANHRILSEIITRHTKPDPYED